MSLEKNLSLFQEFIGWQIVGVEQFDGRLLVMLSNGTASKILEVDRYAKIKKAR